MSGVPARTPDVQIYPALFRAVKGALLEGQRRIEAEKVRTYWEAGRLIQTHILLNNGRAEYGSEVMDRLSKDLAVSTTVLHRCVKFFKSYPSLQKVARGPQFSWSHYRKFIAVADNRERSRLEGLVTKGGWSAEELAQRMSERRFAAEDAEVPSPALAFVPPPSSLPIPLRGRLYTYQIQKRKVLSRGATELVVDVGFSMFKDVDQKLLLSFSSGDIVESRPREDAYRFYKGGRTAKDLYTYQAYVERVIDGDTLKVHIDLGFEMWTRQTLRLRGIDCPEVSTRDGDAAKAFVQSYLKEADRIILRSSRDDKYGRYLADIFLPQASGEEDIFLNGFLLESGHAKRWAG